VVAAAAQADDLATSVKRQAALSAKPPASAKPLTIGDVSLELVPDGAPLGTPMAAGPVTERDAGIARREFPAGLDTRNVSGTTYRVYTMPMAGTGSGLVRASEPVATGARDRTTPPRTLSLDLEPTLVVGDEEACTGPSSTCSTTRWPGLLPRATSRSRYGTAGCA